jgi:hypothetical protein
MAKFTSCVIHPVVTVLTELLACSNPLSKSPGAQPRATPHVESGGSPSAAAAPGPLPPICGRDVAEPWSRVSPSGAFFEKSNFHTSLSESVPSPP